MFGSRVGQQRVPHLTSHGDRRLHVPLSTTTSAVDMADKPTKNSEKSATTTSVAPATLKSTRSWLLAKAFLSLSVIGLSNYASQPALHPLYGEKATGLYFPHTVAGAMVLAMMVPMSAESEGFLWHLLAAVLSLAPYSAYTFGAATARWGNFMWGPIAAQVPLAISTTVIGSWLLRTLMVCLLMPFAVDG